MGIFSMLEEECVVPKGTDMTYKDKLLAKHYVQRIENALDRRRVDIYLTEEGSKVMELASRELDAILNNTNQELSLDEAAMLSDLLDKLRI